MARGRSTRRMPSAQRGNSNTATPFDVLWRIPTISTTPTLTDVEDNRRFNPEPDVARDITGRRVRFSISSVVRPPAVHVHRRPFIARNYYTNTPVGIQLPYGVKFRGMFPVVTCVRRKIRKAVLFALGRTRKGSGAKKRNRNSRSGVRC